MSANINVNEKTGKASVFTVKEPAWHKLGQVLENPATAEEAIIAAGLNFEVQKKPLYFNYKKDRVKIEDKHAMVRMDTGESLGIVGNAYTPIQNLEAFSFFDNLVSSKEAIYHTAGALGKGERIWIAAKLPTSIVMSKDDLIENYVLIYNSHDGSAAISALMTPIRVVCNNTLTAALKTTKNKVSIRHTKNVVERLKEAHKLLGLANKYREEIESCYRILANKKVTSELANKYLSSVYDYMEDGILVERAKRTKEKIMDIFESSVGGQDMPSCRGTMFGMFNALTFYDDNVCDFKDESSRAYSIWFGGTATERDKAFKKALELSVM